MKRHSIAAALLATAIPLAHAEEPRNRFISVTVDNDWFAGYDRHYTNGVQVAWPWNDDTVVAIGHRIYTPVDTLSPVADPGDRPYAGWLYGQLDKRFTHPGYVDHLTFTLGMVGPSARGRQVQNGFHHVTRGDQAKGWDAQLHDELAASVGYERAWPAWLATRYEGHTLDLSPRVAATLGNVFTYAAAGAVLRYGRNLPSDVPATHVSLGPPRDGYRGAAGFGWYVWAGLEGRAVAHNIFLDGNTSKDSASVDRKPFGYDGQLGVVLAWSTGRVGFTWVHRSPEFRSQGSADQFGQLTFSFAY